MTAARDVSLQEPKRAFDLERSAAAKLEKMGVKVVTDVDKASFFRRSPIPILTSSPRNSVRMRKRSRP